jgi:hypothetical protein
MQAYATRMAPPESGSEGFGVNPYSGNDDLFPFWFGRAGDGQTTVDYKGTSTIYVLGSTQRTIGTTFSVAGVGAKDYAVLDNNWWDNKRIVVAVPWDGTDPVLA